METIIFELSGEYIELNNLLKVVGVADSGGAGKALVAAGEVSVDGTLESRKTAKIRVGQVVTLAGVRIEVVEGAAE
ncbi:RNA-binding S4 domain-containing protein [Chitinivorax sp. PXF-14]|uniref:RNA-binding S4 domain-containing protein n=1 Tax=Chitinivorax sp. PXF-14 TaxID=3230488 RepID=UPI0034666592